MTEVAERLVELAAEAPAGRVPDMGGCSQKSIFEMSMRSREEVVFGSAARPASMSILIGSDAPWSCEGLVDEWFKVL